MVLIFHHPYEGLKTFARMLDEQPTTSGEGQATEKSFPTTKTGWGNGFWKLSAITGTFLLQEFRG